MLKYSSSNYSSRKKEEDGRVLPEVSPGLLGHVVSLDVPSEVLYRAALLLEATVSPTQVKQRLGLTAACISNPCGGWEASLLQTLYAHKPQRAAQTATAELCRFKGKMLRTKSNRSNMSPCLMVRRPSFQLGRFFFFCLAKLHGLFGIFTEGVNAPVADETISVAALQEAFPRENVQSHFIAWNILSRAIADNGDRDTLRHASLPTAGWRALVATYSTSTRGAKVQCLQSLTSRHVKPGANPIPVLAAMIEGVRNMHANGLYIEDKIVCLLFLRALRDEYNVFRQMLEREREKLIIDRLRTELRARYVLLKGGKSSKSTDIAFLGSGTKRGISGRRQEKCGNVSGIKKKDGRAMREDSNGQGSSRAAGGSNGATSGKRGGPTRCKICKETAHKWFKCPKRICSVCQEPGYDPNSWPQVVKEDDANLAITGGDRRSSGDELDGMCEYLQSESVLDAFFSTSAGKLFDPDSGMREGINCEVGELEP